MKYHNKIVATTDCPPLGGLGGASVPPSAHAEAERHTTSARLAINLRIDCPPSFKDQREDRVRAIVTDLTPSYVTEFFRLVNESPYAAREFLHKVLRECPGNDYETLSRCAVLESIVSRELNDYRGSLNTLLIARPLLALAPKPGLIGAHLHARGKLYHRLNEFDNAFECFTGARIEFEEVADLSNCASTDNNTALLKIDCGRPEEAYKYVDRAERLWRALKMPVYAAEACDTRALAYLSEGRTTEALTEAVRAVNGGAMSGWTTIERIKQDEGNS